MRAHPTMTFGTFHPYGMDVAHPILDHKRVVASVQSTITNGASVTVRRQIVETGVILAFAAELAVVFMALGW